MSKKRTILSWDQRIELPRRLVEAHRVERLLPSQCGKTQMAHNMISKQTRLATVAYVEKSIRVQYLCCYMLHYFSFY